MGSWFHNREQELRRGSGKAWTHRQEQQGAAPADPDFEKPINVQPILKAFKGRATAASTLFARANRELIAKRRGSQSIGRWKRAVSVLFHQLPVDEHKVWQDKARALKKERQKKGSDPFECVACTLAQCQDANYCSRNQKDFPRLLGEVQHSFLGSHPGGIGSAIMATTIGMRAKDDAIHTHR